MERARLISRVTLRCILADSPVTAGQNLAGFRGELGQKIRIEQIDLIHRDVETAARHLAIARAETNTAFYSLGFSGHNNKDNR